jgi:uncharacterized protein
MLYLDTRFITPIVLPEATSHRVEEFICMQQPGEMAVSYWTPIEFAALVARRLRMGELKNVHATRARAGFDRLLSESFQILLPTLSDYDRAIEMLTDYRSGIRSGDALHLAIARNQGARFITLDMKRIRAARLVGFIADSGICAWAQIGDTDRFFFLFDN